MTQSSCNLAHLGVGAVLAGVATLSLVVPSAGFLAGPAVAILDVYLLVVIVEVARRSATTRTYNCGIPQPKAPVMFRLPDRTPSLLLLLFILCASTAGYGRLYLQVPCGVAQLSPVQTERTAQGPSSEVPAVVAAPCTFSQPTSSSRLDAAYFSAVTLMTVGYGDFVPVAPAAKRLVLWEFLTGVLVLLTVLPMLVSRFADF